MRNIPLVDLKAGFTPIKREVMKALEDVLTEMHLFLGPNCQELEKEFASYCGMSADLAGDFGICRRCRFRHRGNTICTAIMWSKKRR